MTANKHTPGPWVQVSVTGGWDGVAEAANRKSHICALKLNNPANARLISAAPELLEALESIMHFADGFDCYRTTTPLGKALDGWLEAGRAAIAKATGGAE